TGNLHVYDEELALAVFGKTDTTRFSIGACREARRTEWKDGSAAGDDGRCRRARASDQGSPQRACRKARRPPEQCTVRWLQAPPREKKCLRSPHATPEGRLPPPRCREKSRLGCGSS